MSSRWLAIVNPEAGAMRHGYLGRAFLQKLSACVADIAYSSGGGDATNIAANARDYDGLVAVGGDGTIAEILTGMNLESQRLAVVPAGTGNCLAIDLGLTTGKAALQAITQGRPRRIDIMEAALCHADGSTSRKYLASTAGMGYSTDVAILAKSHFSQLRGYAYVAAAGFVRPRHRLFHMTSDNGAPIRLSLTGLLVNNTRHIGKVRPFPAAAIDDGVLDCFVFQTGWVRQCLHDLEMATGLPIYGTPQPRSLKRLHLRFDMPETVMLDGELVQQVTEMELACKPAALTCMGLGA